jgi:phosphohistidine phosphatase
MLSLYLLRHGESAPESRSTGDIGRTLTPEGRLKIAALAASLKARNIRFDHLVVSPATRTIETKSVLESVSGEISFEIEDSIYEASPRTFIDVICRQSKKHGSVLVIGHNPGISAVAAYFSGEHYVNLSPGTMAVIYFDLDDWKMVSEGSGYLVDIFQ